MNFIPFWLKSIVLITSFRIPYEFLESGPEGKRLDTLKIEEGLDLKLSKRISDSKPIAIFLDWNELIASGEDKDKG